MTKVIEPLNLDFELQLDNSEKYYSHNYLPLFNLSGNVGFVTNSSSVIYSFPKEILLDANVATFIKDHELHHGFIGDDLWQRDKCTSLAITKEQKIYINKKLNQEEEYYYESLCVNEDNDDIILIYGDEYDSIVSTLAQIMENAAKKLKIEFISRDYN